MNELYLGVDGGGTNTRALLIDKDKNILGKGQSQGSNKNVAGFDIAFANFKNAVLDAVSSYENIIAKFALAGIDTESDRARWQSAFEADPALSGKFLKASFVNDIVAAVRSGTNDKNAIALISGTGSSCWGHNEHQGVAKSGGVSHILSDEGSAYFIGDKVLRAIIRSIDGRNETTELTKLFFREFSVNSLEEIVDLVYKKPWDKTDIAKVAPLVEEAALNQDKAALAIIDAATNELVAMVKAVATKLEIIDLPYHVVLVGSVLDNLKTVSANLQHCVKEFSPEVKFTKPQIDSTTAAAYLALEDKNILL